MTMEALAVEFADLYRATRVARGMVCSNLEVAVRFATESVVSDCLRLSDPVAFLTDEVAWQRECLEKITI